MQLPEDDERYLNEKGYIWSLVADGAGACLLLSEYRLDAARYTPATTTIMVRLPAQYPMANLDMFYADPPVRLTSGGYPDRADQFETHAGQQWQRFSRHLETPWRPGVDGIESFLAIIARELRPAVKAA